MIITKSDIKAVEQALKKLEDNDGLRVENDGEDFRDKLNSLRPLLLRVAGRGATPKKGKMR